MKTRYALISPEVAIDPVNITPISESSAGGRLRYPLISVPTITDGVEKSLRKTKLILYFVFNLIEMYKILCI